VIEVMLRREDKGFLCEGVAFCPIVILKAFAKRLTF